MRALSTFILVVGCLLGVSSAFAAREGDATAQTRPAATGATPAPSTVLGPEHRRLEVLVGRWNVRQTLWVDPDKTPKIDHGIANFASILGGRHVRQDLRIQSPGKTFEGLGYIGFNDATGRYDTLWMDINFTGVIIAHGEYDATRDTYTFVGEMADPAQRGATIPLREVVRIVDTEHFVFEYYERRNGREALAVRLEYTRA